METLLLTRSQVAGLLEPRALLAVMRDAFASYSTERTIDARRVSVPLPPSESAPDASGMLLAPGLVPGIPAYSVKVHAKFPGSDPAIRGVLVLHDLADGAPLAIMESSHLTALRAGLAGALGADVLARKDASVVAIIGAGAQGRLQLATLRLVRKIAAVRVFDPAAEAAERFARDAESEGLATTIAASLDEAIDGADIIVTATWSREPFLFRRHLAAGMHITTLGPDQPGKCELAAETLQSSIVIVDDRRLAVEMGAVGGAGLGEDSIHAELGEVIAGIDPGRAADNEVTVFASVGLAFQDLVAGWLAYRSALERGIGRKVDLLA